MFHKSMINIAHILTVLLVLRWGIDKKMSQNWKTAEDLIVGLNLEIQPKQKKLSMIIEFCEQQGEGCSCSHKIGTDKGKTLGLTSIPHNPQHLSNFLLFWPHAFKLLGIATLWHDVFSSSFTTWAYNPTSGRLRIQPFTHISQSLKQKQKHPACRTWCGKQLGTRNGGFGP